MDLPHLDAHHPLRVLEAEGRTIHLLGIDAPDLSGKFQRTEELVDGVGVGLFLDGLCDVPGDVARVLVPNLREYDVLVAVEGDARELAGAVGREQVVLARLALPRGDVAARHEDDGHQGHRDDDQRDVQPLASKRAHHQLSFSSFSFRRERFSLERRMKHHEDAEGSGGCWHIEQHVVADVRQGFFRERETNVVARFFGHADDGRARCEPGHGALHEQPIAEQGGLAPVAAPSQVGASDDHHAGTVGCLPLLGQLRRESQHEGARLSCALLDGLALFHEGADVLHGYRLRAGH